MANDTTERDFMMVIRQAALMVSAHIGRNRAALGDLATAVDAGLVVIIQWVEWKYDVKRPKIRQ